MRHRGKIEAAINNAQRALELIREQGSLSAYIWRFEPGPGEEAAHLNQTESPASRALSKDLKKRGWKFVGPTTMHAFMQSMGLINDHAAICVTHAEVAAQRRDFVRPR